MKTYVIGDIHGNLLGLLQAIERSPFNQEEDLLISLGDLVDGGPDSAKVIDYLANLKHTLLIRGNHDEWFTTWMNTGKNPVEWLQGGRKTAQSYIDFVKENEGQERFIIPVEGAYRTDLTYLDIPPVHRKFLNSAKNYYIDSNKNCFVHGGFNRHYLLEEQLGYVFYWDRDLWLQALSFKEIPNNIGHGEFKIKEDLNKVFLGHTSTTNWKTTDPMFAANLINLDTGAGEEGKVTIMDVDTLEYWQSDLVKDLYGSNFRRD